MSVGHRKKFWQRDQQELREVLNGLAEFVDSPAERLPSPPPTTAEERTPSSLIDIWEVSQQRLSRLAQDTRRSNLEKTSPQQHAVTPPSSQSSTVPTVELFATASWSESPSDEDAVLSEEGSFLLTQHAEPEATRPESMGNVENAFSNFEW